MIVDTKMILLKGHKYWLLKSNNLYMRQAYHNIYLNPQERPLLGLVSFQVFSSSLCTTSFVLLVMGLGPSRILAYLFAQLLSCYWWWVWVLRFVISPLQAPRCAFCAFGCGLLFGLRSFLFSSLVPLLAGCFSFIYLFTRPQVFIVDIGAPDFISRDKIWMGHHHFPKIHYQKLSPTPAPPHSTHSKPRNSPLVSPPH